MRRPRGNRGHRKRGLQLTEMSSLIEPQEAHTVVEKMCEFSVAPNWRSDAAPRIRQMLDEREHHREPREPVRVGASGHLNGDDAAKTLRVAIDWSRCASSSLTMTGRG